MIRAHVRKTYPSGFVLKAELEASAGVTVLYGPSGAGKTATLDCLAGFTQPDSGRITLDDRLLFDGEARVNVLPRDRGCGYVFQNYALFPHMTVRRNLAFAAYMLPRLERHRAIAELLDRFHIAELAARYPGELSGGQKQRTSIARALIAQPKFLLLDEPGRGLDAALRDDLYDLIGEIKRSLTIPVLLVTHDVEECFALADRVLIYDAGEIVHRATPAELLANPNSPRVASLLGGFNVYEAEVLALDPAKQTSRLKMLSTELDGPHLRGVFKGDRIVVSARPEELRVADRPGANRIRAEAKSVRERAQGLRVDFGEGMVVDVQRADWPPEPRPVWVEIPASALRQLSR